MYIQGSTQSPKRSKPTCVVGLPNFLEGLDLIIGCAPRLATTSCQSGRPFLGGLGWRSAGACKVCQPIYISGMRTACSAQGCTSVLQLRVRHSTHQAAPSHPSSARGTLPLRPTCAGRAQLVLALLQLLLLVQLAVGGLTRLPLLRQAGRPPSCNHATFAARPRRQRLQPIHGPHQLCWQAGCGGLRGGRHKKRNVSGLAT